MRWNAMECEGRRDKDHLEAACLVEAKLRYGYGRHEVHQIVGHAVAGGEQTREAAHLGARIELLRLAEVVVELRARSVGGAGRVRGGRSERGATCHHGVGRWVRVGRGRTMSVCQRW